MMLAEAQEPNTNWRKHWFVVNVLIEIPIIGSFFKKKTLPGAMYAAGKCVAAIAGGTSAMMSILKPTEADDMPSQIAKMSTGMVIGMTTGKVIYNGLCNSGAMLYSYLSNRSSSSYRVANEETEMQTVSLETIDTEVNNSETSKLCNLL